MHQARFGIGQIIWHLKFHYRGVIADVDPAFSLSEQWYQTVAKSRPPKDQPWYHVLVDGSDATTYVAERHLRLAEDARPVRHPQLEQHFSSFNGERYLPRQRSN